jgi:hypothetical protein
MKKTPSQLIPAIAILAAFCSLAFNLVPVTAVAESALDFVLVNDTGYEIDQVYVSPTKAEEWGSDILGQDTLADGKSCKIHFDRAHEATTKWDIKIVFTDKEYRYWTDLDLSAISEVTLHYKNDHATATWK